jgi:sialidase-1
VFVGGVDNVHTYRIPALLVAPGGALLAFSEARKISAGDASPTDLVLKRSLDNGRTWEPLRTVLRGEGPEAYMNPCPVVDGADVRLICMNAHKIGRGQHRQLLLNSRDDGLTWSAPKDLTDTIAAGDDTFVPGPGVSIRTRAGRLVVPGCTNVYAADRTRTDSRSRALLSDDHGRSWRLGAVVDSPMSNESQVLELGDGTLVINFRIQKPADQHPGCRGLAVSRDGGDTWEPSTLAKVLNDVVCQAGWLRIPAPRSDHPDWLVFSNPDTRPGPDGGGRTRMTVKFSPDAGKTWPIARLLHAGPAGYSCPALLPDGCLGLLYECGETRYQQRIRFARVPLDSLSP